MERTAIATDTNSGLTASQAEAMGVALLPMPFLVDGEACLEGKDCGPAEFFSAMRAGKEVSTSQPFPGEVTALWDHLLETHDRVLHFPMSSGLSGTCETAKGLAQGYDGRVLVVDDHRISVTLLQSVRNAKSLLAQGKGAEEVRDILERESGDASIYIAVNTLEYLKKSGRITPAGAALGAVLQIKPVLKIEGGKLDAFQKTRGLHLAKRSMLTAMERDLSGRLAGMDTALFAVYSGDETQGRAWGEEVRAAFPDREVEIWPLPLSICCHIGEGAAALACARRR